MIGRPSREQLWDVHCPPGYLFLFQAVGVATIAEAKLQMAKIFERDRAMTATFVPGVYRLKESSWKWQRDGGFMAFVPK